MHDVDAVDVSREGLSLIDLDDGSLLAMARTGHQEAYATLFSRYSYAAHRLARHLGQKEDSDDVVSESFAQVLDLLSRGKGPDRAFRAYLFTTVRHECARRAKARKRVMPTDDLATIDTPVAFGAGQLDGFERAAIRAAYESLPARWQTVLWHLDVEGRKPHELGPLLDMSANSVSALVYRARAGLREAYLQQHVKDEQPDDSTACRDVRSKLSAFVRRTASVREQERIHTHLESCGDCMAVYLDLQEVNRDVGLIAVPAAAAVSAAGFTAASLVAHVAVLVKGLAAAVVPPLAAAAIASATIVGVSTSGEHEAPRSPLAAATTATTATPQVGDAPESAPPPEAAAGASRATERPSSGASAAPVSQSTDRPASAVPDAARPSVPSPSAAAPSVSAPTADRPTARPTPALPRVLPTIDVPAVLPELDVLKVLAAATGADATPTQRPSAVETDRPAPSTPSDDDAPVAPVEDVTPTP